MAILVINLDYNGLRSRHIVCVHSTRAEPLLTCHLQIYRRSSSSTCALSHPKPIGNPLNPDAYVKLDDGLPDGKLLAILYTELTFILLTSSSLTMVPVSGRCYYMHVVIANFFATGMCKGMVVRRLMLVAGDFCFDRLT